MTPEIDGVAVDTTLIEVETKGNWQLSYDGAIAGPGASITVPSDIAAGWIAQGLAISVT